MPKPADNQPFIALQTSGCRGYCPVYKLTFRNDGQVDYEGIRSVEKMGSSTFNITPEELKILQAVVQKANLWQYPTTIESRVADAPSATLTVFQAGKSHAVMGSIDRPQPLLDLENTLKDLAEAHGLQVKKGVNPNETPEKTKMELIAKLRPDVNAGNWIRQYQTLNLHLMKRLGEENIWQVSYDSAKISEADILKLLRTSPEEVLEVQPNRKTEERH